ncbi:hypothetical protein CI109_104041 [Kwoniella shandongensis]|uniref:Uncharacterized protein n=1 Tax=Kwoniella shandongensis TaxID=1734106 RepID=A0A5M6BXH2_9TREE|nr:uncharacterized protein CI109_004073 [Kwoniella shandongensis]KAA5527534.1 hypothetical protein CI109_004073 [Kwoniella shandongensis]
MPAQPPPTPWLPTSRFADESLLLNAQPIFGDISLGSESEWGEAQTSFDTKTQNTPVASGSRGTTPQQEKGWADVTLDLGDYLPEEVDATRIEETITRRESREITTTTTTADRARSESSTVSTVSNSVHKREGSQSLLSSQTSSKKIKPPTPIRDDLYKRRLSDSNRRSSSSSSISPMLPSLPLPSSSSSSSSQPSSLSSSTSSRPAALNTASSRLKDAIRRKDGERERQAPSGFAASGAVQKHVAPSRAETVGQTQSTTSALARYLAKSSILTPTSESSDDTSITNSATEKPSPADIPPPARPAMSLPSSQKDSQLSNPIESQHDLFSSTPRPKSSQPTELPSPHVSKTLQDSQLSTQTPPANQSSRRESMSEKVVSFFSGLLKPSPSAGPLKYDETLDKADEQETETKDEVATDGAVEVVEKPARPVCGKPVPIHRAGQPSRRPLVAPLTRPIHFSRPLHVRTKPQPPSTTSVKPQATTAKTNMATKQIHRQPLQPSRLQNDNIQKSNRPTTTSAFTSAALARLPPPGKGASSAGQPVRVRDVERAQDLASRRGVFERLATSTSTSSSSSTRNKGPTTTHASGSRKTTLQPTVPVRGHTPGKASQQRAAQRAHFDAIVRQKIEAKEREEEELRRKREEEEEEEWKRKRKETVIWAKPVPAMYHR